MDANRQYIILLVDDDSAIRDVVRDIVQEDLRPAPNEWTILNESHPVLVN